MYHRCPKLVVTGASLLWACFMIYLLTHVQNFANYGGKFKAGASFAQELMSNISHSAFDKVEPSFTASQKINTDIINIIIEANKQNIGGLITAASSVVTNTKHKVHFYFLVPKNTLSHLQQWMKVPELSNIQYSHAILPDELEKYSHASKFAFIDLFPSLEGRAIYLSPDVIVQGDIVELLETPILFQDLGAFSDDCQSGSVPKVGAFHGETRYGTRLNLKQPTVANFEINPLTCTFSTGVFVISDVHTWKKEKVSEKMYELIHSHERSSIVGPSGGSDVIEAAMLIVFYRRASPLDPLWHVRNLGVTRGSRYSPFFLSNAKLLDWNGHFKPWKSSRSFGSTYEQKLWDKYFIRDPLGLFVPLRKRKSEI